MKRLILLPAAGLLVLLLSWNANRRPEPPDPAPEAASPAAARSSLAPTSQLRPEESAALMALAQNEVGVASCDAYRKRFAACGKLPGHTRQAFLRAFEGYRRAGARAEQAGTRAQWADDTGKDCERVGHAWDSSLQNLGC
jgi:hypothetical protein